MSDQMTDLERRLTTIVATDVVGYSRMMEADEAGTLARLKHRRREVLQPLVAKHGGRLFKVMGDGVLLDFPSPVRAVEFAVDLQRSMETANAGIGESERVTMRIGINLGDVIVDGTDLYGDGVNVAARLQALAAPGGICISSGVHDHVATKCSIAFEPAGEQILKNLSRPVRVFHGMPVGATAEGGPVRLHAGPSDKPSIAILPFNNMSDDPEQEFFADGLTEDTTTELSRFHELTVISRNSAFRYKGQVIDLKKVARELNVDYIVEGSVRKAGGRVRINVQLIDAVSDRHVWAERFDRELEDIFTIQDEITAAIAGTLPGRIEAATRKRAEHKPTSSMAAFECLMTARLLHHRASRADNQAALAMVERAIAIDPNYAQARAWRACILGQAWVNSYCEDRDSTWNEVGMELRRAAALDDNDSDVHRISAAIEIASDNLDKATYHQERALGLNPNDDLIVVQQGELLSWLGRGEEGADWIRKAMRLNPYHPQRFWNHLGRAQFVARRYADAIDAFSRLNPLDAQHHAFMAASRAGLGDLPQARDDATSALRLAPDTTVRKLLSGMHYQNPEDRQHLRDALLKAGFPA